MAELIALLLFLSVGAVVTPNLIRVQQHSLQQMRDSATAGQLVEIAQAANQFIQTDYPVLVANAGTQTISIAQLQAAGDLSSDVSDTNPYEQTWEIQVNQPTAGDLQGVVLAMGGDQMTQTEQGDAASQTRGIGGFIPFAANGSTATATGAFGGWQIPMTSFTNPGSGHMVGLLSVDNGQTVDNNDLSRVAVGGQPQLNRMQTTLDAGGNDITNANNVGTNTVTATGAMTAGGAVSAVGAVTAGNGVALLSNDPGAGGLEELTGSNGNVGALLNDNGSLLALVNNNSVLGFQISPGGQFQTNQTITPGAVATQGGGCSPNGALAGTTAGTGQALNCVNGTWQLLGGTGIVDVNTTGTTACTSGTTGILDVLQPFSPVFDGIINAAEENIGFGPNFIIGENNEDLGGGVGLGGGFNAINALGVPINYGNGGDIAIGGNGVAPMVFLSCINGNWGIEEYFSAPETFTNSGGQ